MFRRGLLGPVNERSSVLYRPWPVHVPDFIDRPVLVGAENEVFPTLVDREVRDSEKTFLSRHELSLILHETDWSPVGYDTGRLSLMDPEYGRVLISGVFRFRDHRYLIEAKV